MPDSKQLRIMKKLTEHLEGITPANGYDYDMRKKVYRGRLVVSVPEAEDAMSLLEAPRPLEGVQVGSEKLKRVADWTLLLQGWPTDDRRNPSDSAYGMLAAAEKRLAMIVELDSQGDPKYPDIHLLGKDTEGDWEVVEFRIGQGVVRPPTEAQSRLAMFYLPLVVRLATDPSNPYL